MRKLKAWVTAVGLVALTGAAQAGLVSRAGGSMIYDTARNITWLADMNVNGLMTWANANAWADDLVYGGFDDWRLPTLNPSDTTCSRNFDPGSGYPQQYIGYGCTGGELSGLFVTDLGNKESESVLDQTGDTAEQIANLALFSHVQESTYWSGTEYALFPDDAWIFHASIGFQYTDFKRVPWYAVAVRPGDVAAAVPEPQTLALALLALGAAMVVRRRRPR